MQWNRFCDPCESIRFFARPFSQGCMVFYNVFSSLLFKKKNPGFFGLNFKLNQQGFFCYPAMSAIPIYIPLVGAIGLIKGFN